MITKVTNTTYKDNVSMFLNFSEVYTILQILSVILVFVRTLHWSNLVDLIAVAIIVKEQRTTTIKGKFSIIDMDGRVFNNLSNAH